MSEKVVLLLGRGIEGCGPTKQAIERLHWYEKHGHSLRVLVPNNKKYIRAASHADAKRFEQFDMTNDVEVANTIKVCNEADYVIITSLPPKEIINRTVGYPPLAYDNWKLIVSSIVPPVILQQHDHSIYSIARNACLEETVDRADLILVHKDTNDFTSWLKKHDSEGALNAFFDHEVVRRKHPVVETQSGHDFDLCREQFWKPVDQLQLHTHRWLGRATAWKGYSVMFKFHEHHISKWGTDVTAMEGIEKSVHFKEIRDNFKFEDWNRPNVKVNEVPMVVTERPYMFGPYVNHEMMERMSKTAFGHQMVLLPDKFQGRTIDNQQCEIASVGAQPVFRRECGERTIHRKYGIPFIECKDNFTVWVSDDDQTMASAAEHIKRLQSDTVMLDEWRHGAFEFYKAHSDASITIADSHDKILAHLKTL